MQKETENEETRFFVTFLSLVAFRLEGRAPCPLATRMIVGSISGANLC